MVLKVLAESTHHQPCETLSRAGTPEVPGNQAVRHLHYRPSCGSYRLSLILSEPSPRKTEKARRDTSLTARSAADRSIYFVLAF